MAVVHLRKRQLLLMNSSILLERSLKMWTLRWRNKNSWKKKKNQSRTTLPIGKKY